MMNFAATALLEFIIVVGYLTLLPYLSKMADIGLFHSLQCFGGLEGKEEKLERQTLNVH